MRSPAFLRPVSAHQPVSRQPLSHPASSHQRRPSRHHRGSAAGLLLSLIVLGATPLAALQTALAQDSATQDTATQNSASGAKPGPDFIAFWKSFTRAAKADDKAALLAMTHLPFDFNGDSYEAAQFDAVHKQIYDAKARACLVAGKPAADEENFDVFCGPRIYVFGTEPMLSPDLAQAADGSGWRLLEIDEND
jgi:hypothetical protein